MIFIVPNIISVIANDGLADLALVSLKQMGNAEHPVQITNTKETK